MPIDICTENSGEKFELETASESQLQVVEAVEASSTST